MPALADEGKGGAGGGASPDVQGGRGEHFYSIAGGSEEEGWEVSPIEGGREGQTATTDLFAPRAIAAAGKLMCRTCLQAAEVS